MSEIKFLFSQYRQKGILVDTNILLLYFVGRTNRERISRFNRTQNFIPEDYDLLLQIFSYFQTVATTPNILTEVNSLADKLGEPERSQCFAIFAQSISAFEETYLESRGVVTDQQFTKFGLTDCGILSFARDRYLVLTNSRNSPSAYAVGMDSEGRSIQRPISQVFHPIDSEYSL